MVDYRRFLAKAETKVLAHTGGRRVFDGPRALVTEGDVEPGWWRFEITGKRARATGRAEPELEGLERVRGSFAGGWLFRDGAEPAAVLLLPEEEIAPLSPISARRWHTGELLYDASDFDGDGELAARAALEEGKPANEVKGVGAALRAAFAWALVLRASARLGVPCALSEAHPFLRDVAQGGDAEAEALLRAVEVRRNAGRVLVDGAPRAIDVHGVVARAAQRHWRVAPTVENAPDRAEEALEAAGARLLAARRLGHGRIEVAFRFQGERFVTVADAMTLQVIDAGICLVDHASDHRGDAELTLESLPSVIREAMELGALVVTRR